MTDREKKPGDIETSLRETLDKMEEKLKRYRIDQSSLIGSQYDKVSSRDSGLSTGRLDDTYNYERTPRDINSRRHGYSDREIDYLYDRIDQRKETKSPHQYQGARPNVRFETDQFNKEEDYLPRDNLPYRAYVHQPYLKSDVNRTLNETNREERDSKLTVKPATYDGSSSWLDYKCHFEACASVNGWNEEKKGLFLALSIRGQAQAVLGDLPRDRGQHYETLVRSLQERFSPPNQTELYRVQLKKRRQRPLKTLSELGQAIRRLTNLAYPTAPGEVRETLAKDQFIDALIDSDIRIRIKQSRPANLNEAISLAVELEAYNKVEKRDRELRGHLRTAIADEQPQLHGINVDHKLETWMKSVEEGMKCITEELKELRSSRQKINDDRWFRSDRANNNNQERRCYECKKAEHIRRNCPELRKRQKPHNGLDKGQKDDAQGDKNVARKPNVSVGLGSSVEECGLYVEVQVQGEKVKFLWTLVLL